MPSFIQYFRTNARLFVFSVCVCVCVCVWWGVPTRLQSVLECSGVIWIISTPTTF
jgi:hypothetical protein